MGLISKNSNFQNNAIPENQEFVIGIDSNYGNASKEEIFSKGSNSANNNSLPENQEF